MTLNIQPVTKYFIGRDDGENFGPFDTAEEALKWATTELTDESTLTAYRDEAIDLAAVANPTDSTHGRMLDLITSVDWILFGIVGWGNVHDNDGHSIMDPYNLHSPSTVLQP